MHRVAIPCVFALVMTWANSTFLACGAPPTGETLTDFTSVPPEDLGIHPVAPVKDAASGFITGGKNSTTVLVGLKELNGRAIAALESTMRPGAKAEAASVAGFLGPQERLLDVLAEDNRLVVETWGLTHQELARHLHLVAGIARAAMDDGASAVEFKYHGRRYRVSLQYSRGYQLSPFHDGVRTNTDATVRNLDNGKKIHYSLLVPHLIERYGFYEGHGTPYRVEPRQVVEVFDFLQRDPHAF